MKASHLPPRRSHVLQHTGWNSYIPASMYLLAALLSISPLMQFDAPMPEWWLMVLVFWSIHRYHHMSIIVVCLGGLMIDVFYGGLLGLNGLCALLVYVASSQLRHQLRGVAFTWNVLYLALILWLVMVLRALSYGLLSEYPSISTHILWQWCLSILSYPLCHYCCVRVLHILPLPRSNKATSD